MLKDIIIIEFIKNRIQKKFLANPTFGVHEYKYII